jgi:glycosyltransferase involved in cell wall biosynthesis
MPVDVIPRGKEKLFLATFPPRQCGIATFTRDLIAAVDRATGGFSEVVAVDDAQPGVSYAYSGRVVKRLRQQDRASYAEVARYVNAHSAATLNVQHEFGIFGGDDGDWLFDLLERVRIPVTATLHTVLPEPAPHQRAVVRKLARLAARIVVLSGTGRTLLRERYGVDPHRVRTVPHGIPDVKFEPTEKYKRLFGFEGRFVVSTFGLLGRGKGLETAIEAIAKTARRVPNVLYAILGTTHPVVARREGETYRDELKERIRSLGIGRNVIMIDRYLSVADLLLYLAATDVYVTPYVNPDQIVSGALAYAAGAGKPVVSTPYLYARELLADGRGVLVPFADASAMSDAFRRLASNATVRLAIARRAYEAGREMTWAKAGRAYAAVVDEAAAVAPRTARRGVGSGSF